MAVEIAKHETAAVKEQDQRTGIACLARIVKPQRDRTASQIPHHRQRFRGQIQRLPHGANGRARLGHRQFVDRRSAAFPAGVKKGSDIGPNIGLCHG